MMAVGFVLLLLAIAILFLAITAAKTFRIIASHRDRLVALERNHRSDGRQVDSGPIVH
jgi:hypothetical protein